MPRTRRREWRRRERALSHMRRRADHLTWCRRCVDGVEGKAATGSHWNHDGIAVRRGPSQPIPPSRCGLSGRRTQSHRIERRPKQDNYPRYLTLPLSPQRLRRPHTCHVAPPVTRKQQHAPPHAVSKINTRYTQQHTRTRARHAIRRAASHYGLPIVPGYDASCPAEDAAIHAESRA